MILPPYLIQDDNCAPVQWLGGTGWIVSRVHVGQVIALQRALALSFVTEGEAEQWLARARHDTPALFRGRDAKVTKIEHKPIVEGQPMQSEFEPGDR